MGGRRPRLAVHVGRTFPGVALADPAKVVAKFRANAAGVPDDRGIDEVVGLLDGAGGIDVAALAPHLAAAAA